MFCEQSDRILDALRTPFLNFAFEKKKFIGNTGTWWCFKLFNEISTFSEQGEHSRCLPKSRILVVLDALCTPFEFCV